MQQNAFSSADIERILAGGSPANWLRLAKEGLAVREAQALLLAKGSAFDVYKLARYVPGADIKACQERGLSGGSGSVFRVFAQDITGADVQALELATIKAGDVADVAYFGLNVPNADAQAAYLYVRNKPQSLDPQVLESLRQKALSPAGQNHPETPAFTWVQSELLGNKTIDLAQITWLAIHVRRADIKACEHRLINSGHAWSVCFFAAEAPGANIKACQDMVLEHASAECLYHFARTVPTADVHALHEKAQQMMAGHHLLGRFRTLIDTLVQHNVLDVTQETSMANTATVTQQPTQPLVQTIPNADLLAEINRRGMLQSMCEAIGAMHDHLDRTGALDDRLTQYLAYRLRREEVAITGSPDSDARVANWQGCIDRLDSEDQAEDRPSM